ncbi:MAG: hypothetical protein JWN72_2845, partial [Thermoleophilia bacterium]|nr:hypothetical protein [Thermoleophilia bacterium]
TTAPTVTITGGPANGASTAATSASFTFSAIEASAFTCTLDAAASTTCTSGVTYGSLAVGSHTWSITARDGAGNTSTATTRTWTVVTPPDTTAPTVTITGGPANGSTSTATSAAFTFAANETSAFTCKLDAAAFVTCSSGVSYASLGVGAHTFAVRATDAAGNVSVTVTRTWTVAAAAGGTPATVTTPAGLKVEYGGTPGTVKFTWTAAPDLSSSHTNYQVLRDGSGRAKLGLSTLTWVDSGLDTGVSHYYGVRPISASGSVLGTIREVRYVVPAVPADTGFVHPGIGESRAQLDFVKGRIAAGAEPWTGALAKAKSSRFGKATWAPTPQVDLRCGTAGQPNIGCSNHTDDAVAAYTHALIWYYTGATASRDKALEILNAYSATEQRIYFDSMVNTNGKLTAAWAAETFTRAAEIMRYSGSGWTASDIARFERLLIDVYHPIVWDGWPAHNGNWLSTMANAELAIGVFTNNRSLYDEGINDWRNTTPAQVYMSADGPKPLIPLEGSMTSTTYNNAKFFQQGMYSETCRDLGHTAMGLDSITNAAETAWIQGIDLYGEQQARIIAGYEHLSHYAVHPDDPAWPCPNPVAQGGASNSLVGDVAYNHYAVRRGIPMPELKVRLQSSRPTSAGLHMAWETLTHAAGPL